MVLVYSICKWVADAEYDIRLIVAHRQVRLLGSEKFEKKNT